MIPATSASKRSENIANSTTSQNTQSTSPLWEGREVLPLDMSDEEQTAETANVVFLSSSSSSQEPSENSRKRKSSDENPSSSKRLTSLSSCSSHNTSSSSSSSSSCSSSLGYSSSSSCSSSNTSSSSSGYSSSCSSSISYCSSSSSVSSPFNIFDTPLPTLSGDEPLKIETSNILKLPGRVREIVGSYIDPADTIIARFEQEQEIPQYLQDLARHIIHLDLSERTLSIDQVFNLLNWCRDIKVLGMPKCKFEFMYAKIHLRDTDKYKINEIFTRIATFKDLTHLDISKWISQTNDTLELVIGSGAFESINLNNCREINSAGMQYVARCIALKNLEIANNTNITDAGIKFLELLTDLTSLNVSGTQITDKALESISNFTKLKVLNLSGCNISREGLSFLVTLTELEELNLNNCAFINNGAIKELYSHQNLRVLKLAGTLVNTMGIYCIKSKLPNLTVEDTLPPEPQAENTVAEDNDFDFSSFVGDVGTFVGDVGKMFSEILE